VPKRGRAAPGFHALGYQQNDIPRVRFGLLVLRGDGMTLYVGATTTSSACNARFRGYLSGYHGLWFV
jgi:hypothetical protein